ncbi:MAG: hypothetical protein IKH54_00240 [Bacilli bacterium]|nr:hypothetical protein [Bacilli bacterium]
MLAESTTIGSTLSILDAYGANDDVLTSVASTLTTSLTMYPKYSTHRIYYVGDNYIQSLSKQELVLAEKLINEKIDTVENEEVKVKQLKI